MGDRAGPSGHLIAGSVCVGTGREWPSQSCTASGWQLDRGGCRSWLYLLLSGLWTGGLGQGSGMVRHPQARAPESRRPILEALLRPFTAAPLSTFWTWLLGKSLCLGPSFPGPEGFLLPTASAKLPGIHGKSSILAWHLRVGEGSHLTLSPSPAWNQGRGQAPAPQVAVLASGEQEWR